MRTHSLSNVAFLGFALMIIFSYASPETPKPKNGESNEGGDTFKQISSAFNKHLEFLHHLTPCIKKFFNKNKTPTSKPKPNPTPVDHESKPHPSPVDKPHEPKPKPHESKPKPKPHPSPVEKPHEPAPVSKPDPEPVPVFKKPPFHFHPIFKKLFFSYPKKPSPP